MGNASNWRWQPMAWAVALACMAVGVVWWWSGGSPPGASALPDEDVQRLLTRSRTWMAQKQYEQAEAAANEILRVVPEHPEALVVAGEIAMRRGDLERAAERFEHVGRESATEYVQAQFALGELARIGGRLSDAEAAYRRVLEQQPEHAAALHGVAFVLNISGRRWEGTAFLLRESALTRLSAPELAALGHVEQLIFNPDYLAKCRAAALHDPLPMLGVACVAMGERRWEDAAGLLQDVVSKHPQLMEAQVRLGQFLHETASDREFLAWHAALPAGVEQHPEIWVLRGSWLRSHQQGAAAMRCYWEAARRDPDHRVAVYQLSQLCLAHKQPDDVVQALSARAEKLQALADRLTEVHSAPNDWKRVSTVAQLCRELGRWREARGWAELAAESGLVDPWIRETLEASTRRLGVAAVDGRTVELDPLIARLDFSNEPLPKWPAETAAGQPVANAATADSPIRFVDAAAGSGLTFTYFNSSDPSTDGMRMLESFGGGVGVVDYDRDGWPDLYFTQGCRWPAAAGQREHLDAFYRNQGGRRWSEVSVPAGVDEDRFSTGVAVGDFNNDGFPDVYVGNIGLNRLWLNNGDGTFEDATAAAGLTSTQWTTSCAMADLDGDGLADLFDVNYLQGEALHTLICQENGISRACMPTVFDPCPDEVWRNRGDGTVDSATAAWELHISPQNGLGIVVADFNESGGVDVFVANDAVPNSYYVDLREHLRSRAAIEDTAVLSGLAFDRDGKAQACMGVAAGDADGDGRLDLFVTNYYDESNTLYRQESPQSFVDDTAAFDLRAPSFKLLGFGAQFLDADLDGAEDLVLTNGHVDDFTHAGTPYRMRPQFFRRAGRGFVELRAGSLGDWFDREQLGRGLARLDWNRDGLPDFVVSHLDTPSALLTNETDLSPQHVIRLHVVGIESQRDAVGAVVRARVGERTLVRHVIAGDGYQASNERIITLGLGAAPQVDHVDIVWPSGRTESLSNVPSGSRVIAVEGVGAFSEPEFP